jgi:hypothetical protein
MPATEIEEARKESLQSSFPAKTIPDQTQDSRMTPLLAFSIVLLFVLIIAAGIVLILR